jgi:hypothetical protein
VLPTVPPLRCLSTPPQRPAACVSDRKQASTEATCVCHTLSVTHSVGVFCRLGAGEGGIILNGRRPIVCPFGCLLLPKGVADAAVAGVAPGAPDWPLG